MAKKKSTSRRLGIGFIGSGFVARFHIQSFQAVRDADILGIWSPTRAHAEGAAKLARDLGVGDARAFTSIEEMVAAPEIDAIWVCGPNFKRLEHLEAICSAIDAGKGELLGIACEKPLGRTVAEARTLLAMVEKRGIPNGYLENNLFIPALVRGKEIVWRRGAAIAGRPYLARAAEEHSGPHNPWFWQGKLQGGGVLTDMLCHSVEAGRFLLTEPGKPRESLKVKSVTGQVASLKWSRREYVKLLKEMMGKEVDYERAPAEDFARGTVQYEDEKGNDLVMESTTSWSYVGPGLRLSFELLGPEYAMAINSLDSSLKVFLSRRVTGEGGEDLVEKQNAEQGLMPVVDNEAGYYGYEWENRHMVRRFLDGKPPDETFRDGLATIEILMSLYMSAEQGKSLTFPPPGLDSFVPQVATGSWNPRR